jgi:hypothetical protein
VGPIQSQFYYPGSLYEYLNGCVTCHVTIQQATPEKKEEKCGNIAQLVESDLPIMFKCCIYSERFKYCLTFTKPLMVYFERTFLFCSRCTYERHENTIRINGSRADIQTGDLPTLITNLEHNRKTLLGIQILFFPKKDRIFKKLNFF